MFHIKTNKRKGAMRLNDMPNFKSCKHYKRIWPKVAPDSLLRKKFSRELHSKKECAFYKMKKRRRQG